MKGLLNVLEFCGGIIILLVTIVTIAIGVIVGLTEVPRDLRTRH